MSMRVIECFYPHCIVCLYVCRSVVNEYQLKFDDISLHQQLQTNQTLQLLKSYESRIYAAKQRVELTALLVSQKDVSLRNTLATVEADKRLSRLRMRSVSVRTESDHEDITAATADNSPDELNSMLSDLRVRPEVRLTSSQD